MPIDFSTSSGSMPRLFRSASSALRHFELRVGSASADSPGRRLHANGEPNDTSVCPLSATRMTTFICFSGLSVSERHTLIRLDLICRNSAVPLGPEPDVGKFDLPMVV